VREDSPPNVEARFKREVAKGMNGDLAHKHSAEFRHQGTLGKQYGARATGRNRRTVWNIATQPYSGAHFATWPEALVEPMVKAGTSERGCCPECGAGWAAVVEREAGVKWETPKLDGLAQTGAASHGQGNSTLGASGGSSGWNEHGPKTEVLAYRPTCACHADEADPPSVPGLVLDPFMGSGTTGIVAREEGVDCIGLDLSYDYLHDQARERLGFVALDEWEHGKNGKEGKPLEELPMFAGLPDA